MNVKSCMLIVAAMLLSIGLVACGGQEASSSASESRGASDSAVVEKQSVLSSEASSSKLASSASSSGDYSAQVSIEGDYSYENKYNTYHVLVVKNNSDATLKIVSNSTALDGNGSLVGADDADSRAVGPGCTSYLLEVFSKVSGVSKFETNLSASVDKTASVLQDLELTATSAGSNVVLQCTNSGEQEAEFVQALVLFFEGDALVDTAEKYLSNGSEPLGPGATQSEQVSTRESFDSVSAYLSGRGK